VATPCCRLPSAAQPEFDPSYRMISEYALAATVAPVDGVLLGISSCALALALRSRVRTRAAGWPRVPGRRGLWVRLSRRCSTSRRLMHNVAGASGISRMPVAAARHREPWPQTRLGAVRGVYSCLHMTWIAASCWSRPLSCSSGRSWPRTALCEPGSTSAAARVIGWSVGRRLLVVVDCTWVAVVRDGDPPAIRQWQLPHCKLIQR